MDITPKKIAESGLLTLEDAAIYIGVSVGCMRRLRRLDRVQFEHIGAKLFTKKAYLEAYIEGIFGKD